MAGRGGVTAITGEQRAVILAAEGDEARIEALEDVLDIAEEEFDAFLDKAWDPIHRVLAREDPKAEELPAGSSNDPLELAILGGKPLLEDEVGYSYLMRLVEADQVPQVAAALRSIDEAKFSALYDVHCRGVEPEFNDDGLEYAWHFFPAVRELYERAAKHGRAVIFNGGI